MRTSRPADPELSIDITDVGGFAFLAVTGEIDQSTAGQFRHAIERVLGTQSRIEIDMRGTSFMDSTGLAVLVDAYRRLGRNREAVVLRDPSPLVIRLLEVSGVGSMVEVRRQQEDAYPMNQQPPP